VRRGPVSFATGSLMATVPKRVTMCQDLERFSTEVEEMDKDLLQGVARALGLERALQLFPEDVAAAAAQVEKQRQILRGALFPADEPWPPMRVPDR
jgi:hypothetical protein